VKQEALSLPGFNLTPDFFGLKPEDSVRLHDQLFELVWHGEGRWSWETIYHMPVHIRNFWIRKLNHKLAPQEK